MERTPRSATPETAAEAEWLTGTFSEGSVKGPPKRSHMPHTYTSANAAVGEDLVGHVFAAAGPSDADESELDPEP